MNSGPPLYALKDLPRRIDKLQPPVDAFAPDTNTTDPTRPLAISPQAEYLRHLSLATHPLICAQLSHSLASFVAFR
jgi:hypothetical protein